MKHQISQILVSFNLLNKALSSKLFKLILRFKISITQSEWYMLILQWWIQLIHLRVASESHIWAAKKQSYFINKIKIVRFNKPLFQSFHRPEKDIVSIKLIVVMVMILKCLKEGQRFLNLLMPLSLTIHQVIFNQRNCSNARCDRKSFLRIRLTS